MTPPSELPDDDVPIAPAEVYRFRSVAVCAAALLLVLHLHLLPALFAGIGGFVLYRSLRVRVRAHMQNRSAWITYLLLAIVLAVLGVALFEAFELLLSASSGGLARLLQLLADTLDQLRTTAPQWIAIRLPDSAAALQEAVSGWLRSHAAQVQQWGRDALRVLLYLLLGLVIGLLAGAAAPNPRPGAPLMRIAQHRLLNLALAFRDIIAAQLRISLVNTLVTALYLLVILPLFGYRVPLAPTLVAFTFFASLLPIVGNLLSNAAIVLAALTISPWLGGMSLLFLVVVHKLEYFLNAHFVGSRIQVPAYALLASMLVLEAGFGAAGVVAAPVYCAWLTRELRGGRWI
ncbi:MAG: putative rane protein [Ramlibacter sp.]|jgi:predicted PurR-regulated permease PerM|nr:putative rane protein [Ramlibacter sp.]